MKKGVKTPQSVDKVELNFIEIKGLKTPISIDFSMIYGVFYGIIKESLGGRYADKKV